MPGTPLSFEILIERLKQALRRKGGSGAVCTFVLGSGFSYPLFPLTSEIVRRDLPWWLLWSADHDHEKETFPKCPPESEADCDERARQLWKAVHAEVSTSTDPELTPLRFGLGDDGLPLPADVGRAYQAVLSGACACVDLSIAQRAAYFRSLVKRVGNRLNGAHFFLASLLAELHAPATPHARRLCGSIVTTNFDPLLQRSLQLVNLPYYVSDRPDALLDADDGDGAVHIVHAHGTIYRYLMLNGAREIADAAKQNKPVLSAAFRNHMVVILGYSGWDDAIMAGLAEPESDRHGVYWCDRHATIDESSLSPRAKDLLKSRTGFHYVPLPPGGANEAMAQLYFGLTGHKKPLLLREPVRAMMDQLRE
ncbi:MAG: SIR2 family protein, partial [Phycisphaerales bacterium]|nr:SIR2 family protein [Phycisphaerales bacterium]